MRRWLVVIGVTLGIATLLCGVLVARMYMFAPPETRGAGGFSLDTKIDEAAARLAEALRFPTVSHADPGARDAGALVGSVIGVGFARSIGANEVRLAIYGLTMAQNSFLEQCETGSTRLG